MSYGYNIMPESDMKDLLLEKRTQESGVQYWKGVLGEAGQTYSAQQNVLTSDYSDAIAQAYASNMKNRNAIDASGLNKTGASAASALSRQELMSTFDKYLSNYSSALASAREQYQQNVTAVDKALTTEAQNYRTLYSQKAYEYLTKELGNSSLNGESALASLDWMYNTDKNEMTGEVTKTMRDWEDLLRNELTDEKGNLTVRGQQFYDAAFNFSPSGYEFSDGDTPRATRSFDQYLSETDPELREWYASPDFTNYVNGAIPTKGGSMRNDFGAKLSDYMYNKQEADYRRANGVSEKLSSTVDKAVDSLYNKVSGLKDSAKDLSSRTLGFSGPTVKSDPVTADLSNKEVNIRFDMKADTFKISGANKKPIEKALASAESVEADAKNINEQLRATFKENLTSEEYSEFEKELNTIKIPTLDAYNRLSGWGDKAFEHKEVHEGYYHKVGDPITLGSFTRLFNKYSDEVSDYYNKIKDIAKKYA